MPRLPPRPCYLSDRRLRNRTSIGPRSRSRPPTSATTPTCWNKRARTGSVGGNITIAVGTDGIIMVDANFAPMHDKIKAAIAKISPLPIKYIINTHFHGDHTGGNAAVHKDGTTIVAEDNIRLRLMGGTVNGMNGNKTPPADPAALPTDTYYGGQKTGRGRRPQGAADPCLQRPHRRRHLCLFRRRQCALHRRHLQQHQALPDRRLRQWRRHQGHGPRQCRLSGTEQRRDEGRSRPWRPCQRRRT